MIIRKLFKFEGAHIVRNCSSDRCKRSIHGHSYVVEVFITSDKLDNGGMIVDFGLLKGYISEMIDSFDHTYSLWDVETLEFKRVIKENSARWIEMPISPSAEGYALMFLAVIDRILESTLFNNNEGDVQVASVRVHETATGYAEAFKEDLGIVDVDLMNIVFSDQVVSEWKDSQMWLNILHRYVVVNPIIEITHGK